MAKNINRSKSNLAKNAIPNIVGLSRTTAKALLTSLGFKYTESSTATSDQGNDNELVRSQDITASTVSPLNTNVNYTVYQFGFTPFGFTPFGFVPAPVFSFVPEPVFSFVPAQGCFKYGTKILMSDNTWKNMEYLQVGDEVMSAFIPDLPESEMPDYMPTWSTDSLDGIQYSTTTVANIMHANFSSYYRINDNIEVTWEHFIFAGKPTGKPWRFIQVEDLSIGDLILDHELKVKEVLSKEEIFEEIQTVNIDTEIKDIYFVEGMLAHNILPSKG